MAAGKRGVPARDDHQTYPDEYPLGRKCLTAFGKGRYNEKGACHDQRPSHIGAIVLFPVGLFHFAPPLSSGPRIV